MSNQVCKENKMFPQQDIPAKILLIKEGFRAVIHTKGEIFRATILDSSIPRCFQLLDVPVVFDDSCTIRDLFVRNPRWLRSHVRLLPLNDSQVLFIGKPGLHGGDLCYWCHYCHFLCITGKCCVHCTHSFTIIGAIFLLGFICQNHKCALCEADQRARVERGENRRRMQEVRDRQERHEREQREAEELREQGQLKQTSIMRNACFRLESKGWETLSQPMQHNRWQDYLYDPTLFTEGVEEMNTFMLRAEKKEEVMITLASETWPRASRRQVPIQQEKERQELLERERKDNEKKEREQQRKQEEKELQQRLKQNEQARQERLRQQEEHERQEQLRIARERKEKKVIMSTLWEGVEKTSVIRDDEIKYVSKDEIGDSCNELVFTETVQQEGPLNGEGTDCENLLPKAQDIGSRLLFENFNTLPAEWISDSFIDQPVTETSWYKQIEMPRTDTERVEQRLLFKLIYYPAGNVDEFLLDAFNNFWLDVKELFEFRDCLKILCSLRTKQLAHGLTLLHINDILDMVLSLKWEGLNKICEAQGFWYRELKHCWVKQKLVYEHCDERIFDEIVYLLVNLPWNSLMTRQFVSAVTEIKNPSSIRDLLHEVKNGKIAHPIVMNIINQIQDEEDCATVWTQEIRYQILIKTIYDLSPTHARALNAKLGHLLRNEKANVIKRFINANTIILHANMPNFATILEHLVTYCTTQAIWDQCFDIIKIEKNPEKWIEKIDKTIISSIFGKSHVYNLDELIERIASKHDATDHYQLKNKFNLVELACSRVTGSSRSSTQFTLIYSTAKTNSGASKPVSEWKVEEIRDWARSVKFSPNQVSLEKKIAVISRAVEICHKFSPRATQTLSLLMLANPREFHGRLAQINTGEGKSIIVAMLAVIHALSGAKVDVITTSTELSIPEVKRQQPFFQMFDLTVDENSADRNKPIVYSCDIVYGTASDFQGDILLSEFLGNDCREGRKFDVVIVDEVDSMLFDSRNHSVRLSDKNPGMTHLEVPLAAIWQYIHYINNHMVSINGKVYFIPEDFEAVDQQIKLDSGADWETVSIEVDDKKQFITKHTVDHLEKLLRELTDTERDEYNAYQKKHLQMLEKEEQISKKNGKETSMLKDECKNLREELSKLPWSRQYPTMDIPNHLKRFALNQITVWVKNAILAEWAYKRDAHYMVINGKIVPINFNETGDLQTNMVWSDGLTQFLQMKEGLKMDPEGISTNFISNVSFFQRYGSNIYGLTGTLGEQSTQCFLQEMYGTDMVVIPPYKSIDIANNENSGYRCKELAPLVLSQLDEWYQCIKANAVYHAKNGRGVLIICKYITQVRFLADMLRKRNIHDPKKIFTYTGEETSFKKDIIDSGEVIVATNIAGRGTDFKTTEDVEKNGGMYVLVTFLPESLRVEMQNVGRTAREGKRGMAQLIVHDSKNTPMEELKKIRYVHETQLTNTAIDDAKIMLVQDSLFKKFCFLENELLPSMDEARKWHIWDQLKVQWADYSAQNLNPRKVAEKVVEWSDDMQNKVKQAALHRLTKEQCNKLSVTELRELQSKAVERVATELPAFRMRYRRNVMDQFYINHSSTVPSDVMDAFRRSEKYTPKCSNLALKYKWGTFERKAVEEAWGLWLKSEHFDDKKTSPEEAINKFRKQFEQDLRQRAKDDKLVQNPFFYVLKGNEYMEAKKLEEAIVCCDRAIELDSDFSVNARYNKARALLSYYENRGTKQQVALRELRKAQNLIVSVYRPSLLTFNTLIGQHICPEGTSKHVQHQLDILGQQEVFIEQACEVIETAERNDNNVKVTLKNFYEVFPEAKTEYDKAIREASDNGLKSLFTVEERLPRPWGSIIGVALIGLTQIAVGCLIVIYTGGSQGTGLIAEGVADLVTAATAAIKGTFSWAAWITQKVISIAVSIVCSGIASIKQTIKSAKQAGTLGIGTFNEARKGVLNTYKSGLKDVSRTCYDMLDKIVRPKDGVKLAIQEVGLALGKGVVKECLNEAGKYCSDRLFMKNLEVEISTRVSDSLIKAFSENALVVKALEEDERTGSSYWKDLFIREGMELLKDKEINRCVDMFKKIAKGVADRSIPYAAGIMDIAGVGECMHKLNTYTSNFIKNINKAVNKHETKINEKVVDSSSDTSNQSTQSSVAVNLAEHNQAMAIEVCHAPDVDCDSSDINVRKIEHGTSYSSKSSIQQAATLRSTYREASTPKTLANAFKATITSKLTSSIENKIVSPVINRGSALMTQKIFHSMEESVSKLRHTIKTERDCRSETNDMANASGTEDIQQETQELGEKSQKRIIAMAKDGYLHDTTSLSLAAGVVKAPILVYDETGNLKYKVGDSNPGDPIKIKHFAPSNEHPGGHFCPYDPNVRVTTSGDNTCALDTVVALLDPAQCKSLNINNANDLRDKMIEHVKAHPREAERMFEKRDQLERLDRSRLISGGKKPEFGAFNKKFEDYPYDHDIEPDSETMNHAERKQYQMHHLIPVSYKDHPAIVESGFDIDDPINVIECPVNEDVRKELGTQRSAHCGPHPREVMMEIFISLDEIYKQYKHDPPKMHEEVSKLSGSLRKRVRSGEMPLRNDAR